MKKGKYQIMIGQIDRLSGRLENIGQWDGQRYDTREDAEKAVREYYDGRFPRNIRVVRI